MYSTSVKSWVLIRISLSTAPVFYVHPQEGLTGLHLAAMHDDIDIAQELIGKGCPIDSQDEKVCSTILQFSHSY